MLNTIVSLTKMVVMALYAVNLLVAILGLFFATNTKSTFFFCDPDVLVLLVVAEVLWVVYIGTLSFNHWLSGLFSYVSWVLVVFVKLLVCFILLMLMFWMFYLYVLIFSVLVVALQVVVCLISLIWFLIIDTILFDCWFIG